MISDINVGFEKHKYMLKSKIVIDFIAILII